MLVQYTHITDLTADQKQRLKAFLLHSAVLEGQAFIQFEGLTLSVSDLKVQKRIWENELRAQQPGRQALFG